VNYYGIDSYTYWKWRSKVSLLVYKTERKQADGRTRPTATPFLPTRSVKTFLCFHIFSNKHSFKFFKFFNDVYYNFNFLNIYVHDKSITSNTDWQQGSHRPQTPPRCCHLGSYFKCPKSSPVRSLACNWYYCAQFIAKPKAACAMHFSWAATSNNLGLWANMTSSIKPEVHNVTTPPEKDRATAIGNKHKKLVKIGRALPNKWSRTDKHTHT